MGIIPSRNLENQRREENGIVYFDRGTIEGKDGRKYDRYAIQTHFVAVGESQKELVEKYVRPLYQEGDILSFGAKVMCMCVKSVKTRDEVKPGFWANLLWRFAGINHTGVGAHEPYKMQMIIDICGLPRVLLAAFLSAVTKPFGVHGVFWKVCGHGVAGIDGFYERSSFDLYHELALINPENPDELCEELAQQTGMPVVLMDANDIQRDQLGKSSNMPLTDEQLQDAMADNPSGQGDELTPLILIRPVKE
jgi:F420-0:gamma-glutamyl ligase